MTLHVHVPKSHIRFSPPPQRRWQWVKEQRFEDVGLENHSDAAASQGMLAATKSWERDNRDYLLELLMDGSPVDTLI